MSTIQNLFERVQLAEAAYANFFSNSGALLTADADVRTALEASEFSPSQATAFVNEWEVVSHVPDTTTAGFSATIFKNRQTGAYTLAIRGSTDLTDFSADAALIAADGIAVRQLVDLYNFWNRSTTAGNQTYGIAQVVLYDSFGNLPPGAIRVGSSPYHIVLGDSSQLLDAPLRLGSGAIPTGLGTINVNGHSLGGHLAMAFTRLFPDITSNASAVNGLGFKIGNSTVNSLFSILGGAQIFNASSILNVYGIAGPEFAVMNNGILQQPGDFEGIYIESGGLGTVGGHSSVQMTDSAAVYDLFFRLSAQLRTSTPTTALSTLKPLFEAASNQAEASLERIVDALVNLYGLDFPPLTEGKISNREAFYERIVLLQTLVQGSSTNNPGMHVDVLTTADAQSLALLASGSEALAYRYALKALNPFAIVGDNSLYAIHNPNGELDLYDTIVKTGSLTSAWLTDRAQMLAFAHTVNTNDARSIPSNEVSDQVRYTDLGAVAAGKGGDFVVHLLGGTANFNGPNTRRITFGGDAGEYIRGRDNADSLYGEGGSDYLQGNAGNDYLEGGRGMDVYEYNGRTSVLDPNTNDGNDTILDTDGKGVLRYVFNDGGLLGIGAKSTSTIIRDASNRVSGTQWNSADGKFTYQRSQNDLIVTINGDAGGQLTLKDFREGDYGIYLFDAQREAPQTTRTITGDLQPKDFDLATPGIQTQTDPLGNIIVTSDPEPNRNDILRDSVDNDRIIGGGGNDTLGFARGGNDWMSGDAGRDAILGGTGNDLLEGGTDGVANGETGGDILYGGDGDDELYANGKLALASAIRQGDTQTPTLQKGEFIGGGAGKDWVVGGAGEDFLDGGSGDDIIVGGAGDDNITGDAGYAASSLHWAVAREVQDNRYIMQGIAGFYTAESGPAGADVIYAGAGTDWVFADGGDDFVDGGAGNDVLFGNAGSDVLIGGAGNDYLSGDDVDVDVTGGWGDDYLDGGGDDDTLFGNNGNDVLIGGAGNDELQGNAGDDILIGGAGVDTLFGGAGRDTYVFNKGDGTEVIVDPDDMDGGLDVNGKNTNPNKSIIVLGEGINKSDIKFRTGSLMIDAGNGDEIHLALPDGQIDAAATRLFERLEFADGSTMRFEDVLAQGFDIDGTEGNDNNDIVGQPRNLVGTSVTDRIRGLGGDDLLFGLAGDDMLDGGDGVDTLVGGDGNDAMYGGNGGDILLGEAGDDLLFGGNGDDQLAGGTGDDTLEGGDGNDFLWGGDTLTESGNDTLDGGAGNDQLVGFAGNDTYVFGRGYGQDWVFDEDATVGNIDVVRFAADITPDDIVASRDPGTYDLRLAIDGTFDALIIANHFFVAADEVEEFRFANGTVWTPAMIPMLISGSSGNDVLNGTAGADVFKSGAGNDVMAGGAGEDAYRYFRGDGVDYIIDFDTTAGNVDKIVFAADILPSQVTASRSGNNLRLLISASDQVVVEDYFVNDGVTPKSVEQVKFLSDGTVWDVSMVKQLVLTGTGGNDVLIGYATADNIAGLAGDDTITGNAGGDTLAGGTGNDLLQGGDGNDVYLFARGDGQDTITDSDATAGNVDTLRFAADVLPADVLATRSGNNLTLRISGTTDRLVITDYFSGGSTGANLLERIEFTSTGAVWQYADVSAMALSEVIGTEDADYLTGTSGDDVMSGLGGNDTLNGLQGDDMINGGTGADLMFGGDGNDIMIGGGDGDMLFGGLGNDILDARGGPNSGAEFLSGGAGSDIYKSGYDATQTTVSDVPGTGFSPDTDTILMDADVLPASVIVRREGGNGENLILELAGEPAARLTVLDHFLADGYGSNSIERVQFLSDSTVWDVETINAKVLIATEGNDLIFGFEGRNDFLKGLGGNDVIRGLGGNDTLNGGTGIDDLYGGGGSDTYLFARGDGQDTIFNADGDASGTTDVLLFAAGILPADMIAARSANDLVLAISGTPDQVTLRDYFLGGAAVVEQIRFADGTVWTGQTIADRFPVNGTAGDDILQGSGLAEVINGFAGNDTLRGGAGNDIIDGGTGSDWLYGEDGNDTLIAGAGEARNASIFNHLFGGNGNDILVASGKQDALSGGPGNDLLIGAEGTDFLQDISGNNLMFGGAGLDRFDLGDNRQLIIGGAGDDSIDGDNVNINGIYGQGVLAFNKRDGGDSVVRLGRGSTVSMGGGTLYANLSLEARGTALLLKTGAQHYMFFSDWYDSPASKPVSTLQIVIEGSRDYDVASTDPMRNQKIQTFDFLGLVADYDAAGHPRNYDVAAALAAHRIGGSDTAAIGGSIAYEYALSGTLGTLTYSQMQSVINDPDFGISAQSITPSTAALADTAIATASSDTMQSTLRVADAGVTTSEPSTDAVALLADVSPEDGTADAGNADITAQGLPPTAAPQALERAVAVLPVFDGAIVLPVFLNAPQASAGRHALSAPGLAFDRAYAAPQAQDASTGRAGGSNAAPFDPGSLDTGIPRAQDANPQPPGPIAQRSPSAGGGSGSPLNLQSIIDAIDQFESAPADASVSPGGRQTAASAGAINATPGLNPWALSNALSQYHLARTGEGAGGEIDQWFARGSTQAFSALAAQQGLLGGNFGADAQSLQRFSGLQEGMAPLR